MMSWHRLKIILLLLFVMFIIKPSYAGIDSNITNNAASKSVISKNILDTILIKDFAQNPDFQYKKDLFKKSFFVQTWDNIKMFFYKILRKIFYKLFGINVTESASNIIFWFLIILIISGLGLLLFKFRKQLLTDSGILFSDESEIYIEKVNYNEKYDEAYQNLDYKMAIRYVVLETIKQFDDQKKIKFIPGKTLYEYQQEVSEEEIKVPFSEICYIYEYIWYGNFTATKALCDTAFSDMNFIFNQSNKSQR
ncbi:MAG: hypothetical protein WCP69_00045 [Bacteroidota bacterium]